MRPEAGRYAAANRYGVLPPNDVESDVPIADVAIAELQRFAEASDPFFLGVGFKKPWDRPAYTVQIRGWSLGRSIRTERWRYTESNTDGKSCALFHHDADPGELRTLAYDSLHARIVALRS